MTTAAPANPTNTIPADFTAKHPIRLMTSNARHTLSVPEVIWLTLEWLSYRGGEEDSVDENGIGNVIMERTTPQGNRVWVMNRNHPEPTVMMLPSDY